MNRKLAILVLPALLAPALAACGDDTGSSPDMTMLPDLSAPPAKPGIGAQIDRLGRPAINTAVTNPFDFDGMKNMVQDSYNKDDAAAGWGAAWGGRMANALAVLDVLDGKCGNQALYDATKGGMNFAAAGYAGLAGALSDDQLYLVTSTGTCKQYLAAELGIITGMPIADCGGRGPGYDVIDWSYGVLSGANMPISDGVTASAVAPSDTFPFLGAPNN